MAAIAHLLYPVFVNEVVGRSEVLLRSGRVAALGLNKGRSHYGVAPNVNTIRQCGPESE